MKTTRDIACEIAFHFLGQPYLWGGNDPMAGFDCSGFVIEVLQSVGRLPRTGDWTASALSHLWPTTPVVRRGCLLFWAKNDKIIHVEMVYEKDPLLTIGASGGGSKTDSLQDAINHDAYIKIRPAKQGWVKIVDPFA